MSNFGVFRFGHVFQKGDLPLYIKDLAGFPKSPYLVKYTMFYYPSGCDHAVRVGPKDRTPVNVGVGEYYATGIAGQCGQPGDWYVEWKVQETFDSPVVLERYHFKVFEPSKFCAHGPLPSKSCGCSKFKG